MNDNNRMLLRYVAEGDIRKAQMQAKIILNSITAARDEQFKTNCLAKLNNAEPRFIELPFNMQGFLVAEDVSDFPEQRFLIRESEKAVIEKILKTRKASLKLKEMGVHYTSSLLLSGEPGTGKTELARYIAHKADLPFVYLKFSGLISSALGKTQQNIGLVFDYATRSPCVLCLDEIDAIGMKRGGRDDVAEMSRVTIALMQELDRLPNDVILIGTTNREDQLDAALFRRFSFLHRVRMLDTQSAHDLCEKFFISVGYTASKKEIEDLLSHIDHNYTPSNVTKACTDHIVSWVIEQQEKEGQDA